MLLDACPYRIPRKNEKTGAIVKCTMCIDRISAGGIPACVQSCPTGAMRFGERAAMLELAHKRVEELKKEFPKAHAVDPDDVRVIYVITDDPDKYAEHVGAFLLEGCPCLVDLQLDLAAEEVSRIEAAEDGAQQERLKPAVEEGDDQRHHCDQQRQSECTRYHGRSPRLG